MTTIATSATRLRRWRSARDIAASEVAAAIVLLVILILCFSAPLFTMSPYSLDLAHRLEGPSARHWLGTDSAGRDTFARILYGGRIDVLIGVAAAALSFGIGGLLGLVLGFFRGPVVEVCMRMVDVIQAFPVLVLGLTLLAFFGNGISTFIYVLAFVNIPIFLRLVRSQTLGVRERQYVEAARSVGNPTPRILLRHVLPNVVTSGIVQVTNTAGQAILIVGGLSYLGVGIRPPTPEWGNMIKEGSQFIVSGEWWQSVIPGVAIIITVLTLHTIGEGILRLRRVR